MSEKRKILVFFTNNLNKDCLFGYPKEYTKKAKNEWVDILKQVDSNINDYEYDFIAVSKMPDKKYKAGIKGSKSEGLWVDDEKYFKNSEIKTKTIKKLKNETAKKLDKTDYKILKYQEGFITEQEFKNTKTERQKIRQKYSDLKNKILTTKTIKKFEELTNG